MKAATVKRKLVLGIEAATPASSVALASAAGELLAQAWRERNGPASPLLLPDVERLLTELGAAQSDVAAVAVTLGPGSFTGLRVGLALAKTLAHGWGVPLYGFSTLAMLARRWPMPGHVAALLDARRNEVYGGMYKIAPTHAGAVIAPEAVAADCVAPLGAALEKFETHLQGGPVVLIGGGAVRYKAELEKFWGARATFAPAALMQCAAEAVALAGAAALGGSEHRIDPLEAAPIYLRASDAALRHPAGVVPQPKITPISSAG